MIPDDKQREIKEAAAIEDVARHFLDLKKSGVTLKGLCPFHEERTPSFVVSPSRNTFKCFGCGKSGDSIGFLMEHEGLGYIDSIKWLANFYHIHLEGEKVGDTERTARPKTPKSPQLPASYFDIAIFQSTLSDYGRNNLVQWLCRKLGNDVVMDAVKAYNVGTKEGGTVFWQTSIEGKVGSGKIIKYPDNDHHRIQSINPTWMHSKLGLTDEKKYNWVKYWFGEHLLSAYPEKKVCIVEAEKTALVCSIYFQSEGFLWLASCGIDLTNRDKWKVLQGREVVLYPDLSPDSAAFHKWTGIAEEMQSNGIDASVNTFLEDNADEFERSQKWDLADFLLQRDLSAFGLDEAPPGEGLGQSYSVTTPLPYIDLLKETFDAATDAWIGVLTASDTRERVAHLRAHVNAINAHLAAIDDQIGITVNDYMADEHNQPNQASQSN